MTLRRIRGAEVDPVGITLPREVPSSSMFDKDHVTMKWVDEEQQTSKTYTILFDGPFDTLPKTTDSDLSWKESLANPEFEGALSFTEVGNEFPLVAPCLYLNLHMRIKTTSADFMRVQLALFWGDGESGMKLETNKCGLPQKRKYQNFRQGVLISFLSWDELVRDNGQPKHLRVVFRISTGALDNELVDNNTDHFYRGISAMAKSLRKPIGADVVFECLGNEAGSIEKLYANSILLRTYSTYYETMFSSGFAEGDEAVGNSLRVIRMDDHVDIVHTVLYYLYTKEITLSTDLTLKTEPASLPICTAEGIYALAHRLNLEDLQRKVCAFLLETCTIHNIMEKVFSEFGTRYDKIKQLYTDYFRSHWPEIRKTHSYKDYFARLDETEDIEELIRAFQRFEELTQTCEYAEKLESETDRP